MSLGFQGKYAVSGASQERNELERRALHYLNKNRNSEKYLSPHGVSRVSLGASTVSGWPIARASIALLALSIIGFFLMFFVIRVVSDKSAEEILSRFESIQVGGVNK